MGDNRNYNHNEHDKSDNNGQSSSTVHGGEHRRGRLSQIKNNNATGDGTPNEFISKAEKQ